MQYFDHYLSDLSTVDLMALSDHLHWIAENAPSDSNQAMRQVLKQTAEGIDLIIGIVNRKG